MYGANIGDNNLYLVNDLLSPMYGANEDFYKEVAIKHLLSPMYGANFKNKS